MSAPNLTTKEQLQQYLAGAELQEVLRQTLGSILQRETLPSTEKLVGILGAELTQLAEGAAEPEDEADAAPAPAPEPASSEPGEVVVVRANYDDPAHAAAIQTLLNAYAEDAMGGGEVSPELPTRRAPPTLQTARTHPAVPRRLSIRSELHARPGLGRARARSLRQLRQPRRRLTGSVRPRRVLQSLVPKLAKLPHAFSILAFVDGEAVGLLNCFEGFSTFAAKPL